MGEGENMINDLNPKVLIKVDELRASYTEWRKSERKINIINAYIWNLEKWYWWIYLQGRNRDADAENGLVGRVGEEEGRPNWESSINI